MIDFTTLIKPALTLVGGFILLHVVGLQLNHLVTRGILSQQRFIVLRILLRWLIMIGVLLLVLHEFGINAAQVITALSAVLVLLAVGFIAVWSVLSNTLCALLLLLFPPFRFGDEVEIREPDKDVGVRGKVQGLNLFHTTLHSSSNGRNSLIRVPNIMFFQRVIICREGTDTHDLTLQKTGQPENSDTP